MSEDLQGAPSMDPESGPIREWTRRKADIPADLEIVLEDGSVFARGTAVVQDISFSGALLAKLDLDGDALPARWFRIKLAFKDPEHEGFRAVCTPVRINAREDFSIGVEFDEFWAGEKEES